MERVIAGRFAKSVGLIVLASIATACAPLDDNFGSPGYGSGPYYGGPRYGDPYYRDGYYYDDRRDARRERERLEEEREELEEERRRLERERQRERERDRYTPPPPSRPAPERCPSGFTPSENKCRPEERKRGCKDIRMPGGLGCVRRP